MNAAFFVKHPRTIENLRQLHPLDAERPYEIVSHIALTAIEYENFITDMRADRQFIEDAAAVCASSEMNKCLLVRQRGRTDGVLVVPEKGSFAMWAAYIPRVSEQ